MEHVIWSQGLTRRFGAVPAVDSIDLRVRSGQITAFLGPNGAGKTTTIRLLLGLMKASEGSCEVLGLPPGHRAALSQLGALVESPSLYGHLTALENIEITRLMRNLPRSEADRVLGLVGLRQDARRPVREFSLGMRQRLGVGLALMGNPRLLVLDEPSNGLDPSGIQEMRELLKGLPRESGTSVFLSSHILAEVEQIASDVVVINRGRLRYQGAMDAMGTAGPTQIRVRVGDGDRAIQVLESRGLKVQGGMGQLLIEAPALDAPRIAEHLVNAGLDLYELFPHRSNLEARFLALLGEE